MLAFTNNTVSSPVVQVVNLDGSGLRRLTAESTSSGSPSWSPDGARLAYAAHVPAGEDSDIWIMNASGTGKKALTDLPGNEGFPAWSPDGQQTAFLAGAPTQVTQIYILDVRNGTVKEVTGDQAYKSDLSWSPDGRRILYSAGRGNDVFLIDAEGGEPQKVVSGPADDVSPAWNPAAASSK